jgi:hypothetical protein
VISPYSASATNARSASMIELFSTTLTFGDAS